MKINTDINTQKPEETTPIDKTLVSDQVKIIMKLFDGKEII